MCFLVNDLRLQLTACKRNMRILPGRNLVFTKKFYLADRTQFAFTANCAYMQTVSDHPPDPNRNLETTTVSLGWKTIKRCRKTTTLFWKCRPSFSIEPSGKRVFRAERLKSSEKLREIFGILMRETRIKT